MSIIFGVSILLTVDEKSKFDAILFNLNQVNKPKDRFKTKNMIGVYIYLTAVICLIIFICSSYCY